MKYQKEKPKLTETDRIFLAELSKLIKNATEAFEEYNYAKAKLETETFFWKVFADNYLEIVKSRVYNGNDEEKASAFYTLYNSLLAIVKLMAPITPYVVEEIYQNYFKEFEKKKSIHVESWPEEFKVEEKKNNEGVWNKLIEIIARIRQKKSEAKKAMNSKIILTLPSVAQKELKDVLKDLIAVTNVVELKDGKELSVEFV